MKERRLRTDPLRWIPCRECGEPLELRVERMQKLGGRNFIECEACWHLIWIRRSDVRAAQPVGAGGPDSDTGWHAG